VTALALLAVLAPGPTLESVWESPPNEAKLRAYWWWLNGNVTKAAITRDLEGMREKGFGGAILCDANGAEQGGTHRFRTGQTSPRRLGASSIGTRCARRTGWGWRSA